MTICPLFIQDEDIKGSVASYLPEISDILNNIPRQMLLIFKANDLLRGIETHLETRATASSFLTMSRACVKAIFQHKRRKCTSWSCMVRVGFREQWYMFMLSMYKIFLWFKETPVGRQFIKEHGYSFIKKAIELS
jgi:aarF domain-containing kinase